MSRVNRSFAAVYALLERPRVACNAVVALLAIQSGLLAYSAYVHSPTINEPGHLVAGLSYWKFSRFDVYNVNPPLVKLVAALPVMAVGYEEDWSGFYTGRGARPEFAMGEDFVAANGERSFFLFMIARWACIPFSWLGGIVCYLWARDLYGRPAGIIACAIWCFEPNILAHASLMTPDAHATSLGLAACYSFWRWLKHPTWTQTFVTGVVLGLAELAKTTFILFYPLWPLLWLIYRWPDRRKMRLFDWLREAAMLAVRMIIGLYVLNMGYEFDNSLRPLNEYYFTSKLFTGSGADDSSKRLRESLPASGLTQCLPATAHNRFAGTWLDALPVPFPKQYILGIDAQQRDFESYGRPSYLRGEWRDNGWWYYYLYAVAIKSPLGLLILASIALLHELATTFGFQGPSPANRYRHQSAYSFRDTTILLLPPGIIFAIVSFKSGFCEHMRYALPCFPFFFVWISGTLRIFLDKGNCVAVNCGPLRTITVVVAYAVLSLLLWSITSSIWIYPHSLSYFNETIGGPFNGSRHLIGSDVDWGQDLTYLRTWVRNTSNSNHVRIACHSGFDDDWSDLGIEGVPTTLPELMQSPKSGCYVISARRMIEPVSTRSENLVKRYGSYGESLQRIVDVTFSPLTYSLTIVRIP